MPEEAAAAGLLLYHAPSSHYSMIARLALVEAGRPFAVKAVDIHRARENQAPWFVRLNPQMTVPVLVADGQVLADSRLILRLAFPDAESDAGAALLERIYRFPVDAYTFSWLMRWNPLARFLIPRKLAHIRGDMLNLAETHPDLASAYRARAAVFDQRTIAFSRPPGPRWAELQGESEGILQALEAALDGQACLCGAARGGADIAATVFLARLHFCRQGRAVASHPAVAAYWQRMRARNSFAAADVWDRLRPQLLLKLIG